MSLILSNGFKGLLLSSYVNVKFELAVKSLEDLINKPKVEIYSDGSIELIKNANELPGISELKGRILKDNAYEKLNDKSEFTKFRTGQAGILCRTLNCQIYQTTQIHLIFSDGHLIQIFSALIVRKSLSHSVKIYKL